MPRIPTIGAIGRRETRSGRTTSGLTLLEVMIALAILGGGLLAMLAMQISAMRQGRSGRDYTEAATIAQTQMEALHRADWANVGPAGWNLPGVVVNGSVTGGGGGGAQVAQPYTLTWRIQATGDPNVRLFDVRVTWAEPGAPPGAPVKRYALSSARHNDP